MQFFNVVELNWIKVLKKVITAKRLPIAIDSSEKNTKWN